MPALGGRVLVGITAAFLILVPSLVPAENASVSKLSEITMDEVDDEIVIGIKGSRLPDFTSFTMHEPYRVVIDWAGSELAEVPRDQRFERNLIRSIVTEQFISESETISRIVIELVTHTAYRFESVGREVFVRFKKTALPLVRVSKARKESRLPIADPNRAAIANLGKLPSPDGPLTEPSEVPAPPPPALRAPISERLLADITPEKPKAPSEPIALVRTSAKPATTAQSARKVEKPSLPTPGKSAANGSTPVEELAKLDEPPKALSIKAAPLALAKSPPQIQEAPAAKPQAKPPVPPTVRLASSARIAPRHDEKDSNEARDVEVKTVDPKTVDPKTVDPKVSASEVAKAVETQVAKEEEVELDELEFEDLETTPLEPETQGLAVRLGKVPARPVPATPVPASKAQRLGQLRVQPLPTRPTVARAASSAWIKSSKPVASRSPRTKSMIPAPVRRAKFKGKVSFDGTTDFRPGTRIMKYIGFRQKASVSEVFVRLDKKAKYQVLEESDTKIVLQLFDTVIRVKNNQRALDTSFFPTAVNRVHAKSDASGTRVEISLRRRVPYEVKRVGATIKLLFQNNAR